MVIQNNLRHSKVQMLMLVIQIYLMRFLKMKRIWVHKTWKINVWKIQFISETELTQTIFNQDLAADNLFCLEMFPRKMTTMILIGLKLKLKFSKKNEFSKWKNKSIPLKNDQSEPIIHQLQKHCLKVLIWKNKVNNLNLIFIIGTCSQLRIWKSSYKIIRKY